MLDPEAIDLDGLCEALDDRSGETIWWIDPRSGRVTAAVNGSAEADEVRGAGGRPIAPTEPGDGYRDMADFTASVQHRRAAGLLDRALNGRGAFRRFKNTLFEFPEVRDQWFRFRDARARRRALQWLADQELISLDAAEAAAAHYPDPGPENEDLPAAVAADLALLYGERLGQVLLIGPWASGEGSVESALDLLLVLEDVDSPWAELRRIDELLGAHTERSGITITAQPVTAGAMARPVEPWLIRAKVGSVRLL